MKKLFVEFDKLEKVIHMADIHIRLFQRHGEYRDAFDKLYKELKKLDLTNSAIVVAGDILHAKLDMSPEMIDLASDFLKKLAQIAPTIIFDGNHDLNLSNPHRMNSLYPIVKNIDHSNLFYLTESGVYEMADTQFALFSVIGDPEDWPDVSTMTGKTNIGLYHGPVYGAKTDTNYTISSRHVEVSRFDGLDIVMLGDIHKHQVLQTRNKTRDKPVVVYASSLIQQNHGETLDGHGYVIWDIPKRKFEFVQLQNDTGYVTFDIDQQDLNKFSVPDNLPKNLRLRIFSSVENTKLKKIISVIKKKYKIVDVSVNPSRNSSQTGQRGPLSIDIGDLSDINVQNQFISEWIETNHPIASPELIEQCRAINRKMNGLISNIDQSRNIHWKPLTFSFSNLFSYGEDNFVDFTNMNGTYGIFAPNASGKSSSMEALIYALFDKTPRAYRGDHIMNIRKKTFECELKFEVNGTIYVINRKGKKNKKGAVRVDVKFWKENDDGTETILNGEDRFSTNANIRGIVGTYEDFILTTLSGQTGNSLFIDKSNSERKVLLNQFMGLIVFELLERVANEESKQLQGVLKKFSREDFTDQLVQLQNDIEELNLQLLEVQSNIDTAGLSADQHSVEIEQLNTQKLPVPSNVPSKEVLVSNQASLVKKIDVLTANLVILEQEEKDIDAQFTSVKEKLNDVNLTELEQNYKKYQELERNLSKLEQSYTLASTNIDSKHQTIEQLSTFNYNPDCEVCVENNKSKLERIAEITNHINELTEKSTELAEQITIIKLEMDTLKPDHDKFISAKNLVDIYQKLNVDLQGSRNNIDKSKNRLDTLNADLSNVEVQFEELDKYASALVTNRQVDEKILVHKEELQKIKSTLSSLNDNKMDLHSSVKVKESSRSNIMEQLNEIAQIEKEFEAYRYYMDAVGKDGIPYQLISKTIPVIEGEINNILSQIVPFSIALDVDGKNFGGRIVYDHERSWPLENSSGMERFISSLAIRVALLKASNLPKSNFLIIDEGMGSLDSEYLHGMQLMFDLLKAQFDYVVVISHLDNIRDMVDNIIEIKKVNGYSHINTMN